MDDNDYNFIYEVVDELWKNVSKTISQKTLDENEINFITRCNFDAVLQLIKVQYLAAYIRIKIFKFKFE